MPAQRKYPEELRERAVKMVFEVRDRDGKGRGEITCTSPPAVGRFVLRVPAPFASAGSGDGSCWDVAGWPTSC